MELAPGARLGPYEVLSPLGAGGMGEVWKARDTRLGREVAIKLIVGAGAGDPNLKARFEREARALSALNHPNVVTVYDVGEQDGAQFIVSELVPGESLRVAILRGPVPTDRFLPMASQISRALEAAHAAGIVHRDLKPENIMLTPDGTVKILDFGLARHIRQPSSGTGDTVTQSTVTEAGIVMGTAGYMSPEQICGQEVDCRSDIFAAGVVFYEMASGVRAFQGRTSVETMSAVLKDDPPQLRGKTSGAMAAVIRRCLEKDPAKRYQTAGELSAALAAIGSARRGMPLGWIGAAAGVLLAAGIGWLALHRTPVAVHPIPPAPPATQSVSPPPAVSPAPPPAPTSVSQSPAEVAFQQTFTEGMELLSERKWADASARLTAAVNLKPNAGAPYLGLCRAAAAQQNHDEAIRQCTQAIRFLPNSADAYHERANAYLMAKRQEKAVADIATALQFHDLDVPGALAIRGRAYSDMKRWSEALADLNEAIRLSPNMARYYVLRGIAYNGQSRWQPAIDDFTKALQLQPNNPQAYTQRAIARQRSGDPPGAAADRDQARGLRKQ